MLTACAWYERIRLGDRWVDAARGKEPPQFTHGICKSRLEDVTRRRSIATPAR